MDGVWSVPSGWRAVRLCCAQQSHVLCIGVLGLRPRNQVSVLKFPPSVVQGNLLQWAAFRSRSRWGLRIKRRRQTHLCSELLPVRVFQLSRVCVGRERVCDSRLRIVDTLAVVFSSPVETDTSSRCKPCVNTVYSQAHGHSATVEGTQRGQQCNVSPGCSTICLSLQ